jgi:hypothetical protein
MLDRSSVRETLPRALYDIAKSWLMYPYPFESRQENRAFRYLQHLFSELTLTLAAFMSDTIPRIDIL